MAQEDLKLTPLIKLPPERVKELEASRVEMRRARAAIEVLKKAGMETKTLEEKLVWAEEMQEMLLKEFT